MATSDAHDWNFLGKYDRLYFVQDVLQVTAFCTENDAFLTMRQSVTALLLAAHEVVSRHIECERVQSTLTPEQIAEMRRSIGEAERVKKELRDHGFNVPD